MAFHWLEADQAFRLIGRPVLFPMLGQALGLGPLGPLSPLMFSPRLSRNAFGALSLTVPNTCISCLQ